MPGPGAQLHLLNDGLTVNTSSSHSRVKQSRPHSPVASTPDTPHLQDVKPPAPKRARKAINCEPCRSSKLKCDRNRPCSSCVLRGTTASCYQNHDGDPVGRPDEPSISRVDPAAEFARIRQSIALLEAHVQQQNGTARSTSVGNSTSTAGSAGIAPKSAISSQTPTATGHASGSTKENTRYSNSPDLTETRNDSVPGLLGHSDSGGFYAGPTSALSQLLSVRDDSHDGPLPSIDNLGSSLRSSRVLSGNSAANALYQSYDDDLISLLPPTHTIDGLVDFYFEYCNWIYRHVNQPAFTQNWERFKAGYGGDRVVLATVCILILLAVRYLPAGHPLMATLPGTCEELETRYYGVMREAMQRHQRDLRRDGMGKGYTLDLVEHLLVRSHYLTFAKEDPEETWAVKGELVNIGTAMGLHKDPGETRFTLEEAERRRWAWWHIILFERWQAFMFGRPLSIMANHYNTRLPSYCDPAIDKTGRLYMPNISLLKLAAVLGHIMQDAVSFQPVSYASIEEHDKRLRDWYDDMPEELDLDEYRAARSLASPATAVRRVGVLSVIIRTAYHHIRFTLHRPYANIPLSLDIAVSAASKLINLVVRTRTEFLSNTALAVPGHMNWGPFHIFSAAMFFSFQLITRPEQHAAPLFRDNIRTVIVCLQDSRRMPVADKALTILQALAPLYSDDFAKEPLHQQRRKKAQVLKVVKTLAFPYQDAAGARGDSSGGSSPTLDSSPARMEEVSPSPYPAMLRQNQMHTQIPLSSMRWAPAEPDISGQHQPMADVPSTSGMHRSSPVGASIPQQHQRHVHSYPLHHSIPSPYDMAYHDQAASSQQNHVMPQSSQSGTFYIPPAASGWGASVGFGQGEWTEFLDVMQRSDDHGRGPTVVAK
ncbi:hypothetical protein BDW22DRAFT_1351330 [Trametopsis cervina]|nr:hypothetical protein BDW22DRAFT_1351330 [Trametopsis cervina]